METATSNGGQQQRHTAPGDEVSDEEISAAVEEAANAQPEPPVFVRDADDVAIEMRRIVFNDQHRPEDRINAAQVLLNATQAVELWRQQNQMVTIERDRNEQLRRLQAGGNLLVPGFSAGPL